MKTRGSRKTAGAGTKGRARTPSKTAAAKENPAADIETVSETPSQHEGVSDGQQILASPVDGVADSKDGDLHVEVEQQNPEETGKGGDSDVKSINPSTASSEVAFLRPEETPVALKVGEDTEIIDAREAPEGMLASENLEENDMKEGLEEVRMPKEEENDIKEEEVRMSKENDDHSTAGHEVQQMDIDGSAVSFVSEGEQKENPQKSDEVVGNVIAATTLFDDNQSSRSEKQDTVAGEPISDSKVDDTKEAINSHTVYESECTRELEVIEKDVIEVCKDLQQAGAIEGETEATNGEHSEEQVLELETEAILTLDEKIGSLGATQSEHKGEEEFEAQHAMPISERRKQKKLEVFVGGLDKEATEDDLRNVFQKVGDVTEIRLMVNSQTGKNKGYAFVRYANAAQAKRATEELQHVQICGRTCGVLQSEENDVLFVGNISKDWRQESILEALAKYEIEALEEVILMEDPQNEGMNRGFAFLEFATHKDALKAFKQLQKPDVIFGTERAAKVSWAQPLNEPDEEVMAQVKAVFVDGMPLTWDEEQVKEQFGKFGEIERVMLARNLPSAKRKDFGFIHYSTRDAALTCIEALNKAELAEGETKVKLKVMLAKPQSKSRFIKGSTRGGYPGHETGRGRGGGLGRTGGQGGRGFTRNNYLSSRGSRDYNARASSNLQQIFQSVKERAFEEERQLASQRSALWGSRGPIAGRGRSYNTFPGRKQRSNIGREDHNVGRGFGAQVAGQLGQQMPYKERFGVDTGNYGINANRSNRGAPVSANSGRPVHGYAAPAAASKRPYSAMDDGSKYADRQTRARLDQTVPTPFGVGSSQYRSGPFYNRTPVGGSQYSGNVGPEPTTFTAIPSSNVTGAGQQRPYEVYDMHQQNVGHGGNTSYAPVGHGYERDYRMESTSQRNPEVEPNRGQVHPGRRQGTAGAGSGFYY